MEQGLINTREGDKDRQGDGFFVYKQVKIGEIETVKYGMTNQNVDIQLPDDIKIEYIYEKVGGNMKIQNYIENSFEKMNLLDITVSEQEKQRTINDILKMPSDMLNDMEKYQILGLVLDNIGRAEYNIENKEYKLFSNNVYSFDTEVMDIDMMYTIFLNFVNKLSNDELKITDILEDNNNIDYEQGTGEKIVSFKLNSKEYKYIAKVKNDWFDMEMIGYINKILQENNCKKFLYVSSDGWQNCILFYNTEEWAEKFNSNFTEINIEKIESK